MSVLSADWPAPQGVIAFTTLRHGGGASQAPFDDFNLGARCGDDAAAVAENRLRLIRKEKLPAAPHWLKQVHGTGVTRFDAALEHDDDSEREADAAVTDATGVVLAILSADCLPVVFAAMDGSEIGAAHAGWRGLASGILERTVEAMRASPAELVAWLGPAAGRQAYEIGEEVFDAFVADDAAAKAAFVATRPGHWRVDLYALAQRRLRAAGVDRIHGGGLCTISDPQRFYSHRRDRRTGRMATIIYRQP